jgi:MoaA/NifB/PqqE/SkfB family radical SAM enzyme
MRQFPGLFERLRGAVEQLRSRQAVQTPWLRVNTILTKQNVDSFRLFCETMAGWGFDELTINQLGGNDRPEYFPDNRLTSEQVIRLIAELPSITASCRLRGMIVRSSPKYLHRIYASANNETISMGDCSPGDRFLFVDELGQVSPCSFTSQSLGVLIEELDTVAKLNELGRMFREKRCVTMPECCSDCNATHVFAKFAECSLVR